MSVAKNIDYDRPQAAREEIIAVDRAARDQDSILYLPDAYDSLLGDRGQSLSGTRKSVMPRFSY
ncbi:MAG: hypothetical protein JXM70_18775 [Pirellulales bacterium]|nr:hypothetical protein [Pirellulales bacterium]